jgi:GNAT superfamily N-acetyltransferase
MTEVTLRRAGGTDAPAIAEVFLSARRTMTYLPVVHTDDQVARYFFDLVTVADGQVAVRRDSVIGFAVVRAGWLEHLYVNPSEQSAGVGSRLIDWAKGTSPTGIDLWLFERNTRAHSLYLAHGWRDVGATGGDNEEGQPDIHMRWTPGG